jgi:cytochrome c oxidase subunit 1
MTGGSPVEALVTGDHKRVGKAFIYASILFLIVGAVAAGVLRAELTSAGLNILDKGSAGQVFTLHATTMVFLFLIPMWLGIATYIVPLQVGAPRVAFPRLHALAFWLFLFGGIVACVSYTVAGGPSVAKILLQPDALKGIAGAGAASRLWLMGMAAVSLGVLAAAASLVATVVKLRAPGLTLLRLPPMTFATLVASSVLLLAVPTFIAGLGTLYVTIGNGGRMFNNGASTMVWQHLVWLYGRPELFAFLVFSLGAFADIVQTHARRAIEPYAPLLAFIALTGALGFVVWASDTANVTRTLLPFYTPVDALPMVPFAFGVLLTLGTLGRGRPRPTAALAHAVGFVLMLALAGVFVVISPALNVKGGTAFTSAHVHVLFFATSMFAGFAAIYHWAPKMWGRRLSEGLGFVQFLLLLAGTLVAFVPEYTSLRDQPRFDATVGGGANVVAAIGGVLIALAVIVLILNIAGSVWARRGAEVGDDPWEGATLEWLTTSPPPPDNFDLESLPEIRSERPLDDRRAAGATV